MVLVSYKNNTQERRKQAHRNLNCIKAFLIVCVKSKASETCCPGALTSFYCGTRMAFLTSWQSQPALPFPFLQSSFRILLVIIRIISLAALCSFLFPQKPQELRGNLFLRSSASSCCMQNSPFPTSVLPVCLSAA